MGAFKCVDNGESDDKLVALVVGETASAGYSEYAKDKIKWYLSSYKEGFIVGEFVGVEEAYAILMQDLDAYIHE